MPSAYKTKRRYKGPSHFRQHDTTKHFEKCDRTCVFFSDDCLECQSKTTRIKWNIGPKLQLKTPHPTKNRKRGVHIVMISYSKQVLLSSETLLHKYQIRRCRTTKTPTTEIYRRESFKHGRTSNTFLWLFCNIVCELVI